MSNRFHNKFHRANHHSQKTGKNAIHVDAAFDPIASYAEPFQGEFYSDGELVTHAYLSAGGDIFGKNLFIEENLTVNKNLSVYGDFFVFGEVSTLETRTQITSAVQIINRGTQPALQVTQTGNQPVAEFFDDTNSALYIGGGLLNPGFVGIGTNTPNKKFTVVGDISGSSNLYVGGTTIKLHNDIVLSAPLANLLSADSEFAIGVTKTGTTNEVITRALSGTLESRQINNVVWDTAANFLTGGSLIPNYLTKFDSLNTLTNSIVYDDGVGVGINTNVLGTDTLTVAGTSKFNSTVKVDTDLIVGLTTSTKELSVGDISTFGGDLTVGLAGSSPILFVDTINDRVGVGTNTPFADLHIDSIGTMIVPAGPNVGRIAIQGGFRFNTLSNFFEGYDGITWNRLDAPPVAGLYLALSGGNVWGPLSASNTFYAVSATNEMLTVITDLSVGQDLFVNVNGTITQNLSVGNHLTTDTLKVNLSAEFGSGTATLYVNDLNQVAINTETPTEALHVDGNVLGTGTAEFGSGTTTLFVDSVNKVGININTPNEALTVVGNISASGSIFGANFYPQRRFDYDPAAGLPGPASYSGTAPFGVAETDPAWSIVRIVYYTTTGAVSATQSATSVDWTGRTLHTYV